MAYLHAADALTFSACSREMPIDKSTSSDYNTACSHAAHTFMKSTSLVHSRATTTDKSTSADYSHLVRDEHGLTCATSRPARRYAPACWSCFAIYFGGARPAERRECGWMLPDRATTVPLLWSRIPPRPPLFQFKSSIGGVARESYGTAA